MKYSREQLSDIGFWGIIGINLLYLNGLFMNFFKITAIFSPIILVCCFLVIFNTPKPKFNSYIVVLLFLFYFLYLYIATLSAISFPENLHYKVDLSLFYKGYFSSILIYFSIFQYIQNTYNKFGFKKIIRMINISCSLLLIPLFFTIFGEQIGLTEAMTYTRDYGDRQIGIFSNPNTTGLHANYCLCFVLYSLMTKRKGKLFYLLLIPVCCYAAFLSLSKAAMLMVIVSISFYLIFSIFYFTKINNSSRLISIVASFVIISTSIYIYNNFEKIMGGLTYAQYHRILDAIDISQGKINDKTTSERSTLAILAFPKIKDHFLIGNGFGSFHRLKETGLGVHNTSLLIIGESGFLPILVYFLFILLYLYKAIKQKIPALSYLFIACLLSYILISFLTSHNALDERMGNIIIALSVSILSLKRDFNEELNKERLNSIGYNEIV